MKQYEYMVYSVGPNYTESKEYYGKESGLLFGQCTMQVFQTKLKQIGIDGWLMLTREKMNDEATEFVFARELLDAAEKQSTIEI